MARTDVLAACPTERVRAMKRNHPGNLLTVSAISAILKVDVSTIYVLIKRYNLEKLYIDKWAYLVDGEKLWDALHDDPEHVYLTLRR